MGRNQQIADPTAHDFAASNATSTAFLGGKQKSWMLGSFQPPSILRPKTNLPNARHQPPATTANHHIAGSTQTVAHIPVSQSNDSPLVLSPAISEQNVVIPNVEGLANGLTDVDTPMASTRPAVLPSPAPSDEDRNERLSLSNTASPNTPFAQLPKRLHGEQPSYGPKRPRLQEYIPMQRPNSGIMYSHNAPVYQEGSSLGADYIRNTARAQLATVPAQQVLPSNQTNLERRGDTSQFSHINQSVSQAQVPRPPSPARPASAITHNVPGGIRPVHVHRKSNVPDPSLNLRRHIPSLTHYTDSRGGLNKLEQFEAGRVTCLQTACELEDYQFLLLHQCIFIHKVDPSFLPPSLLKFPYLKAGIQHLQSLLAVGPASDETGREFYVNFPSPWQQVASQAPDCFNYNIIQLQKVFAALDTQWNKFINYIKLKGRPPLVVDVTQWLNVQSPVLQRIIFEATLRRVWGNEIYNNQKAGKFMTELFEKDQREGSSLNPDPLVSNAINGQMIYLVQAYKGYMQQPQPGVQPVQHFSGPRPPQPNPHAQQVYYQAHQIYQQAAHQHSQTQGPPQHSLQSPVTRFHPGQQSSSSRNSAPFTPTQLQHSPLSPNFPAPGRTWPLPHPPKPAHTIQLRRSSQHITTPVQSPPVQAHPQTTNRGGGRTGSHGSIPSTQVPTQPPMGTQQLPKKSLLVLPPPGFVANQPAIPDPNRSALHQLHLRSPMIQPRSDCLKSWNRMYRHVTGFAMSPSELSVRQIQKWSFMVPDNINLPTDVPHEPRDVPKTRLVSPSTKCHRLRCVKWTRKGCSSELERKWFLEDTSWPPNCYWKVNENLLEPQRKLHHGKDQPIDITHYVRNGENNVELSVVRLSKDTKPLNYAVAIEVVSFTSHSDITAACSTVGFVSAVDSLGSIKAKLTILENDDDISIVDNNTTIGLFDPWIGGRMWEVPVRGRDCPHRECFDLETLLSTRKGKKGDAIENHTDDWRCPICRGDVRPQNLIVDGFLIEVKKTLADQGKLNTRAIVIEADGSWQSKPEKQSEQPEPDKESIKNAASTTPAPIVPAADPIIIELDSD